MSSTARTHDRRRHEPSQERGRSLPSRHREPRWGCAAPFSNRCTRFENRRGPSRRAAAAANGCKQRSDLPLLLHIVAARYVAPRRRADRLTEQLLCWRPAAPALRRKTLPALHRRVFVSRAPRPSLMRVAARPVREQKHAPSLHPALQAVTHRRIAQPAPIQITNAASARRHLRSAVREPVASMARAQGFPLNPGRLAALHRLGPAAQSRTNCTVAHSLRRLSCRRGRQPRCQACFKTGARTCAGPAADLRVLCLLRQPPRVQGGGPSRDGRRALREARQRLQAPRQKVHRNRRRPHLLQGCPPPHPPVLPALHLYSARRAPAS